MKVELSDQVVAFVKRQAPEPRKRLRRALRNLATEKGDIIALEGPLGGYHRLRVGAYRVIFAYTKTKRPSIRCLFAEKRGIVYTVFSQILQRHVLRD